MKAIRILVSGRVQGVFYRGSTQAEAQRLGLCGWVRNLPDGRVEICLEGESSAVDALVSWCRLGPPMAHVEAVEIVESAAEGHSDFRILR